MGRGYRSTAGRGRDVEGEPGTGSSAVCKMWDRTHEVGFKFEGRREVEGKRSRSGGRGCGLGGVL